MGLYEAQKGRIECIDLNTGSSLETTTTQLKNLFSPKVILINHEKRLGIDTTCANLAIKYNMIYISVYQIIKQHIEENTAFGKKLKAAMKPKNITFTT